MTSKERSKRWYAVNGARINAAKRAATAAKRAATAAAKARACGNGHLTPELDANGACCECKRDAKRRYRERHKERLRGEEKLYRRARKAITNKRLREKRQADPRPSMLRAARRSAAKSRLPFNLTLDDIFVPAHCPALGIPLAVSTGKIAPNSPSLDKLIPELGYVRGNVHVISYKANALKNNASPEELTRVAKWLRAVYPQWLLID